MRGSLGVGLLLGIIVGAGGMYLTLRPPWGGGGAAPPPDASIVAAVPPDAGAPKAKPKPKRRGGGAARPGPGAAGEGEGDAPEPPPLTEADRRLEWRGDDVTLPPRRIDAGGSGAEARPLDDSEINAAFSQAAGVRECVVQGATGTDLSAQITVQLVVEGTGRVSRSRLHAPRYLLERGLLACTQRALARMRFAATGAPTLVTIPVNLN